MPQVVGDGGIETESQQQEVFHDQFNIRDCPEGLAGLVILKRETVIHVELHTVK